MQKGQQQHQQEVRILHAASTLNNVAIRLLERGKALPEAMLS